MASRPTTNGAQCGPQRLHAPEQDPARRGAWRHGLARFGRMREGVHRL